MMLLTIKAKLNPTDEQRQALLATMERFNEACNYVSSLSFQEQNSASEHFKSSTIVIFAITTVCQHS